ncbi:hypothetical protein NDU88_001306 [Pleurodeles waltl]|uniref:Uncharacterized protein n=1 Tax=Pleurodeles waltl TaxID=8319 RepID=A0AAV7ND06_PLEWA|nr:hypothetical protein NDU88_001306 [Pleurodeles waltl]
MTHPQPRWNRGGGGKSSSSRPASRAPPGVKFHRSACQSASPAVPPAPDMQADMRPGGPGSCSPPLPHLDPGPGLNVTRPAPGGKQPTSGGSCLQDRQAGPVRPAPESSGPGRSRRVNSMRLPRLPAAPDQRGVPFLQRRRPPCASAGTPRPGVNAATKSTPGSPSSSRCSCRESARSSGGARAPGRYNLWLIGGTSSWDTPGGPANRRTGPEKVVYSGG